MKNIVFTVALCITQALFAGVDIAKESHLIETYDFSALEETTHMLKWLHPNVIESIKLEFSNQVHEQLTGTKLLGLHVTSGPDWLTGAIPNPNDDTTMIMVRIGVAFSFVFSILKPNGEVHNLKGVYTWVSVNMNNPSEIAQRTWVDLDGNLEEFGLNGHLKERIFFEKSNMD